MGWVGVVAGGGGRGQGTEVDGGGHRLEETGLACVGELYKQVIHIYIYERACAVWRPSGAHHLIEFVVRPDEH